MKRTGSEGDSRPARAAVAGITVAVLVLAAFAVWALVESL